MFDRIGGARPRSTSWSTWPRRLLVDGRRALLGDPVRRDHPLPRHRARSDYVTTTFAAPMMIRARLGPGDQHLLARRGRLPALDAVRRREGGIDKLTQDTALRTRRHGVTIVSLWPGLVLTEGLLANTDDGARRPPRPAGLDLSLRRDAQVQRPGGGRARHRPRGHASAPVARSSPASWPASTASPRTTAPCRRSPTGLRRHGRRRHPRYWRGVEPLRDSPSQTLTALEQGARHGDRLMLVSADGHGGPRSPTTPLHRPVVPRPVRRLRT